LQSNLSYEIENTSFSKFNSPYNYRKSGFPKSSLYNNYSFYQTKDFSQKSKINKSVNIGYYQQTEENNDDLDKTNNDSYDKITSQKLIIFKNILLDFKEKSSKYQNLPLEIDLIYRQIMNNGNQEEDFIKMLKKENVELKEKLLKAEKKIELFDCKNKNKETKNNNIKSNNTSNNKQINEIMNKSKMMDKIQELDTLSNHSNDELKEEKPQTFKKTKQ